MKASDYVVSYLIENGLDKVFGYIGGAIAHLYDSLDKSDKIELVNTIHEQGAGFAAEGYARATGKTGIATATSGPGATNLITAIGSCYFDSVPVLFITGQVNTYEYKYEQPVRQIGFQETDIVSIVKPITKYTVLVDNLDKLRYELEKSIFITQNGRKGPVVIDIPMNIQRGEIDPVKQISFFDSEEYRHLTSSKPEADLSEVAELLNKSSRPVFLVGGGCRLADAGNDIRMLLEKHSIPVVYSLMGKDVVKDDYKYNLGLIGTYGNRYGNLALANSDLIVVLGSRLDTRQTGTNRKIFARAAKIVHVDIDPSELNAKITADISILSDVKSFVKDLLKIDLTIDIKEWLYVIDGYKAKYPSTMSINGNKKIPNMIIEKISACCAKEDIICIDVGQHQMWSAQSFQTKGDQRVLFSGGMGAMGFALPAAIGATIGSGKRSVVIIGDGGFQMNIQELEVLARRPLPIKIFILNNSNLGMVREFQQIYFEARYVGTQKDYSAPDFSKIAAAYGIKGFNVEGIEAIYAKIEKSLSDDSCEVINILLPDKFTTVEPKLIVNKPIEDMYPFLDRDELKSDMLINLAEED
ncbi:thiamine pyrophosphate-binding protein [Seleniivibrio woodruffii]|uniref:thiamine pyrophosphate-binding protein n=1 Tax=Seleniivibrio woodruffii TaxID=1078050 RepID=UPI002409FA42|nr:thiamine pyrophosphate-binding protein [Seleniivibrio woodruffii]